MSKAEEFANVYIGFPPEVDEDIATTRARCGFIAGYEQAQQDFIEKACDAYCKVCGHYPHTTPNHICRQACDYYKDFRKSMKGE